MKLQNNEVKMSQKEKENIRFKIKLISFSEYI